MEAPFTQFFLLRFLCILFLFPSNSDASRRLIDPFRQNLHHLARHFCQRVLLAQTRTTYRLRQTLEKEWEMTLSPKRIDLNCYGFVSYLVRLRHQEAYEDLKRQMLLLKGKVPVSSDGIPCPFNYHALIKQEKSDFFQRISHPHAKPGDILTYQPHDYSPAPVANFDKKPDTHIVILGNHIASIGSVDLYWMYDSSHAAHNISDSRHRLFSKSASGIGYSILRLHRNQAGRWTHLQWKSSKLYARDIEVGRLRSGKCATKVAKSVEIH